MTGNLWNIHPQIHILNNYITAESVVNAVLSVGAVAIGGDALLECAQITERSDALVINTGTPAPSRLDVFLSSGKRANELDIPIVLDPVGAGATDFRRDMLKTLLNEVHFSCIRGNASEIRALINILKISKKAVDGSNYTEQESNGAHGLTRREGNNLQDFTGVESKEQVISQKELFDLSKCTGAVIVVTGRNVMIADQVSDYFVELPGGSFMQKLFTGAGCMLSAVIGAFLGGEKKDGNRKRKSIEVEGSKEVKVSKGNQNTACFAAIQTAVATYNAAARRADIICQKEKRFGTMSFKNTFIDELSKSRLGSRHRFNSADTFLYAITNRDCLKEGITLESAVEQAILGGATMVQLREKEMTTEEYIKTAISINAICRKYDIPLIINDSVYVCKAVHASGVHLGLSDGSIEEARKTLGDDYIIGATAHNLQEAKRAFEQGADYLGVGAAFGSATKMDASKITTFDMYKEVTGAVPIPVVAIGGINYDNVHKLKHLGLSGIAVISGIFDALDIKENTMRLNKKAKEEILR
ncbi:MAG: thiamine phosphate synthase [Butyrivibrio sp.]|nr:thiamine phosphate synthase [Butyrivibrio sp.]MBQ8032240.1 thiamine phosphate synthase [Butyrivibrio sp.]MBR1641005.1 thiamine phosphate synthase [Butyrivibrio sp.]